MGLAANKEMLMKTCTTVVIMFLLASFTLSKDAGAEYRIALVIGNGAYDVGPLSNPPNDAKLMHDTLYNLGFEVDGYKNVRTQKKMKMLIRDFGKRLEAHKDSVGLFYYSGHGMQVGGRNYMIPVEETIENESDVKLNGVEVNEVLTRMEYANNFMNFVILDACRNNPYEKSFKSPTKAKGLGKMISPKGTLIAYAAEPHNVALQGAGKYSYFTEELAKEIVKPNISVNDMLTEVRVAVLKRTNGKQLPAVETMLLANFYFNPESEPKLPEQVEPKLPEQVIKLRKSPIDLSLLNSYKIGIYVIDSNPRLIEGAEIIKEELTKKLKEYSIEPQIEVKKRGKAFYRERVFPPKGFEIRYEEDWETKVAGQLFAVLKDIFPEVNFNMVPVANATPNPNFISIFLPLD